MALGMQSGPLLCPLLALRQEASGKGFVTKDRVSSYCNVLAAIL